MSHHSMGIDFGVTTTVAALSDENELTTIEDAHERSVIPSVVAYPPMSKPLVGRSAKERKAIDPSNTIYSMKRIIGEPWTSSLVKRFIDQYPFFKLERRNENIPYFCTRKGEFTSVEICSKLLEHVREIASKKIEVPSRIVIGVPSAFSKRQRTATAGAARKAGFKDALCVEEPLAIAWAFIHENLKPSRNIAVYDLGGGTFDLAICEVRGGGIGLLAAGGDEYLGGDDIDRLCAVWVVNQVLRQHKWDIRTSPEAMGSLLTECERAKITLSKEKTASIRLEVVEETDLFFGEKVSIGVDLLEQLATDLVRRTFVVCDEVLGQAKLKVSDIDEVYLAGGSSQLPFIVNAVEGYFGQSPITSKTPEQLVAAGAALISRKCELY